MLIFKCPILRTCARPEGCGEEEEGEGEDIIGRTSHASSASCPPLSPPLSFKELYTLVACVNKKRMPAQKKRRSCAGMNECAREERGGDLNRGDGKRSYGLNERLHRGDNTPPQSQHSACTVPRAGGAGRPPRGGAAPLLPRWRPGRLRYQKELKTFIVVFGSSGSRTSKRSDREADNSRGQPGKEARGAGP